MLSICLWEQRESNPRPSACKADALNQLSYAPFFSFLFGNNCIILRSSVSHVLMYTPFLFLVFFILAQNKLRKVYLLKRTSPFGTANVCNIFYSAKKIRLCLPDTLLFQI